MAIKSAKANTGKDTPMGEKMNSLEKKANSFKTTESGHSSDSGSTDSELSSKAGSLYGGAVSNSGKGGDKALQNR